MVEAVRGGAPLRQVARRFKVAASTVLRWVRRAAGRRLDRCEWADRPSGARRAWNRLASSLEEQILCARYALKEHSILGEYGAQAIRAQLARQGVSALPSVRTIGRVLSRHGALDQRARVRRSPPPRGWYLPEVVSGRAELDSFDVIVDLKLKDGPWFSVLTGIALHGGQVAAWPECPLNAQRVVGRLLQHFGELGRPHYAQFDNDTLFQGAHQYADSFGRVIRLCLALQITPVFVPPNEPGFQAPIEHFNGLWQAKCWQRRRFVSLTELAEHNTRYIAAHRAHTRARADAAPPRRPMPTAFRLELNAPLRGVVIYLRRTDEHGRVALLGHRFAINPLWVHRLVRCEVDLTAHCIRCFALRRRAPDEQTLLASLPYHRADKPFQGKP